jgi:hypothetical protein
MEAGDRHQMRQPERAQVVPVLRQQPTRVTQRQRLHEARALPLHLAGDGRRHALAPGRQPDRLAQRRRRRTYVPTAGYPLQQRMPLGIEATRVAQPTRCAQPGLQRPALPGA